MTDDSGIVVLTGGDEGYNGARRLGPTPMETEGGHQRLFFAWQRLAAQIRDDFEIFGVAVFRGVIEIWDMDIYDRSIQLLQR